ncbi:40S ribosomal protein S8, partial [Musa troglodytarum]
GLGGVREKAEAERVVALPPPTNQFSHRSRCLLGLISIRVGHPVTRLTSTSSVYRRGGVAVVAFEEGMDEGGQGLVIAAAAGIASQPAAIVAPETSPRILPEGIGHPLGPHGNCHFRGFKGPKLLSPLPTAVLADTSFSRSFRTDGRYLAGLHAQEACYWGQEEGLEEEEKLGSRALLFDFPKYPTKGQGFGMSILEVLYLFELLWFRFILAVDPARYELGRQPANTKLSSNKTVRRVRVRGGNVKWRALRLDTGNYSWGSEAVTRRTRVLDVVYNASNNELVRTQTLVKSAIVQVDATAFKHWYLQHYGVEIGRKKAPAASKKEATEVPEGEAAAEEAKKSNHVTRKLEKRQQGRTLDPHIEEQFGAGRLLACISSRPGQCGRADGYILEGKELEFYMKKIQRKKGKGAGAAA